MPCEPPDRSSAAPPSYTADVVIVGDGPAGCAAAITLAAFAPSLRVRLVTAEAPVTARGEHVPPLIRNLLAPLGLWQAFQHDGHRPTSGHRSAWGCDALARHDGIFRADRTGWQLDRERFDGMLRRAAHKKASVDIGRVREVIRIAEGLTLILDSGRSITTRFALDASGRAAVLIRAIGIQPMLRDRLTAVAAALPAAAAGPAELAIESVRYGWWYASTPPIGPRVVACMTDSDQIRDLRLRDPMSFLALLRQTRHLDCRSAMRLEHPPRVCSALSSHVPLPSDVPMLAAGDAAGGRDPLTGFGICRALRSGIHAAYAIGDWLCRSDRHGLERFRALQAREETAERAALSATYRQETRWPDHIFWRRRIGLPRDLLAPNSSYEPTERSLISRRHAMGR